MVLRRLQIVEKLNIPRSGQRAPNEVLYLSDFAGPSIRVIRGIFGKTAILQTKTYIKKRTQLEHVSLQPTIWQMILGVADFSGVSLVLHACSLGT